jgi:hypothetical protein
MNEFDSECMRCRRHFNQSFKEHFDSRLALCPECQREERLKL